VPTHWKVVDMSCVSAEVQEETWDRYRVLEPLLEEYAGGRVPEERIADRIREYVEEQERRLVRGERTSRVFGGHGASGMKGEQVGLVSVRSVQRWMRMFEMSGRDIRSLVPGYAQRGKRGMKLSQEVEDILRMAVERVYLRRERAPVTHVKDVGEGDDCGEERDSFGRRSGIGGAVENEYLPLYRPLGSGGGRYRT
jgi:hypothetical protein